MAPSHTWLHSGRLLQVPHIPRTTLCPFEVHPRKCQLCSVWTCPPPSAAELAADAPAHPDQTTLWGELPEPEPFRIVPPKSDRDQEAGVPAHSRIAKGK